MSEDAIDSQPRRRQARWLVVPVVLLLILLLHFRITTPAPSYTFLLGDHAIDAMFDNTGGRWYYYMPALAPDTSARLADELRPQLVAQGFVEDTTHRPWFRFTKGLREVVVCYHHQIATCPTGGLSETPHVVKCGPLAQPYHNSVVLWCREPGQNKPGVLLYRLEARLHRY